MNSDLCGTLVTLDEDVGVTLPQPPQILRPQVQHIQDSLQFAYSAGAGVEDAILHLFLYRVYLPLDKASGTVRILFLNFSSAFNTIQPLTYSIKLQDKLN